MESVFTFMDLCNRCLRRTSTYWSFLNLELYSLLNDYSTDNVEMHRTSKQWICAQYWRVETLQINRRCQQRRFLKVVFESSVSPENSILNFWTRSSYEIKREQWHLERFPPTRRAERNRIKTIPNNLSPTGVKWVSQPKLFIPKTSPNHLSYNYYGGIYC